MRSAARERRKRVRVLLVMTGTTSSGMTTSESDMPCREWSLENQSPMKIKRFQNVVIDCTGNAFNFQSNQGNLTMDVGSTLHYMNCDLLRYEFPENNWVYDTVHAITNSTFGMRSCKVRQANADASRALVVTVEVHCMPYLQIPVCCSLSRASTLSMLRCWWSCRPMQLSRQPSSWTKAQLQQYISSRATLTPCWDRNSGLKSATARLTAAAKTLLCLRHSV